MPPRLVACFIITIIYLPIPFVFWHGSRIVVRAIEDEAGIGRISLLVYLMTVGKRHPSLRRSQLVTLGGIVYVFIIIFALFICGLMVVH